MARVPEDATAFAHRDRRVLLALDAVYGDAARRPEHEAWVDAAVAAVDQGVPGAYAGFLGHGERDGARRAYPGATWDRLAAIKRRYDPDDTFHHTHHVPPAEG
ncbi:BBE domain-containing protein [Euzebya sp.]|uniref:BBE domain-containing protein n=1 Tax=Euzebya sp. TaxID=1971409 RepID=UPI00351881C3